MKAETIHATGLVLGTSGVMLRGPSGAGKSLLALELMDIWEGRNLPAMLISDDRIEIEAAEGGLVMRALKAIEGLIEPRGRGIVRRPFAPSAPLNLVVDLVDQFERMIEEDQLMTTLQGVPVARCPVPRAGIVDSRRRLLLIREALRALSPTAKGHKKTP